MENLTQESQESQESQDNNISIQNTENSNKINISFNTNNLKSNLIDSTNNDNNIDSIELSKVCKTVDCLEKIHHIEIAKILKSNNVYLNENNNGIFVNLNKISSYVYKEIVNYIEFVKKQECDINKDEKLKKNLETTYFKDNKDNNLNTLSN